MNHRSMNKPQVPNNSYQVRIVLLLAGITLCIGLIAFRMFNLQILAHSYYAELAADQHDLQETILPRRGEIYLDSVSGKEPVLAATNVTKNTIYAVPKEVKDPAVTAAKLASVLNLPVEEIQEKLKSTSNYSPIKKQVEDEQAKSIKDLKLAGVYAEPETVRFYPEGSIASHVLGFLGFKGNSRIGQYGVEGKFEKQLAGSSGLMGIEKDLAGRWITVASRNFVPEQDGDDVHLTIDLAIQHKAQDVLKAAVESHGALQGSVIVMNPKTGAVMAMANYPDFNPNEYNKVADVSVYSNTALTADYEPGSVFKPIIMAAAINENKVTPDTTYEDTGVAEIDEFKIKNSDGKANGVQTMTQVLEKSLNTGMIFVSKQMSHDKFKDYVERFGFGKKTGIDLPNEVFGNIDNLQKKGDIFFATASYGQGITTTPIQMITAYTALANGGKMMRPYVVEKIVHPNGDVEQTRPEKIAQVIDPKTAAQVTAMLVNVVENGHGKKAGVAGYYIAGKTGTAQVAYKDRVGYDPSKNIGSFIGYGPVDNPQFLMLVRIDHPKNVTFAESTAAPAFGEIAAFILNNLQVPPSR